MANEMKIEHLKPSQLRANPWNTNVVSPDNERKLEASIERLGFFKPVLCRELPDGSLEVLGGEHRWLAAKSLGHATIPVINYGLVDDQIAKEISLVDNGRYGEDDALELAALLNSLGDISELASFMPYETAEMEKLFQATQIALDDLELDEEDETPILPAAKPTQEFQMMHFKVPIADVHIIQERIESILKSQKFTGGDSLLNAGNALIYLFTTTDN